MTAKRGLFWYVDGKLLCFPVSGEETDTVGNNHRRFWVYLHPSLCTPEIDTRIRQAFSLPNEMQVSFKADGSRHYRSIQEEQEG